jgi:hypothetical protein
MNWSPTKAKEKKEAEKKFRIDERKKLEEECETNPEINEN